MDASTKLTWLLVVVAIFIDKMHFTLLHTYSFQKIQFEVDYKNFFPLIRCYICSKIQCEEQKYENDKLEEEITPFNIIV